jgi:selenide,water dikinase
MAVVGEVHPDRLLTNAGLVAGQSLILTKPLGIGIITTAQKRNVVDDATIAAAIDSMTRTNAAAAAVAVAAGATGATDVTGFGLLGHAGRMAQESGVSLRIDVDAVPVINGARELAADGVVPGGTGRNLAWILESVEIGDGVSELDVTILGDAQTSGGLVFGVDPEHADGVVAELEASGHTAARIGAVTSGDGAILLARG